MSQHVLTFCTILHFSCLVMLCLYGMHRIWMLAAYRSVRRKRTVSPELTDDIRELRITVQLPIYNERFVAERLINAVKNLHWPKGLLDIQILDDSTDETSGMIRDLIRRTDQRTIKINHIRRHARDGYKAGALAHGLKTAAGDFVAVFDADFIPEPDFLEKMMPYFENPSVGMIQAGWSFINSRYSILTRLQNLLLGPHFEFEHQVRFCKGLFFNFNGTAGIWRKSAITDSGGWQSDTVTEDLDLSYRAQLRGWAFVYAGHVSVASELPVTVGAFRTQQQRWAKGSVQTARKILPELLRSDLPLTIKIEAFMHLLANMGWLYGCLLTLTLYPTILSRITVGTFHILWIDIPLFTASCGAILTYYAVFAVHTGRHRDLFLLPFFPAFSIGLSPAIAFSVLSGLFHKGGRFERTPKFGVTDQREMSGSTVPFFGRNVVFVLVNLSFFIYTCFPLFFAYARNTWPALPFLSLYPVGFLIVLLMDVTSLKLHWGLRRTSSSASTP